LGRAREASREREGLDAVEDRLQREHELQQEAAVEVHRAGDVAEEQEPHLAPLALSEAQLDEIAAIEVRPERPPQVDAAPPRHGSPATRELAGEAAGDLDGQPEHLVE